ncbi:unnamed protein product, partial [Leptidea sinapis]
NNYNQIVQVSGVKFKSEELAIYRTGNVLLSAPYQHPAYLSLCTLFCQLYLERPPVHHPVAVQPVGPLYFAGLIKTRALAQIKKRLQEAIAYHSNQIESLKSNQLKLDAPETPKRASVAQSRSSNDIFPQLSLADMIEQSIDSEENAADEDRNATVADNGVKAMAAAWSASIPSTPVPPATEVRPRHSGPPRAAHVTPHGRALRAIRAGGDQANKRGKKIHLKSLVDECNFMDSRTVLYFAKEQLLEVEKIASEWSTEVQRVSQLDAKLWELVVKLRVARPLPPADEWCISRGVEQEIQENRRSYRAGVRRICRARPHFARTAANLHILAK